MANRRLVLAVTLTILATVSTARSAAASVIAIGTGAFGAGSTLTTFAGLANGTEVNGLSVGGIQFQYSLGSGIVVLDGGPGVTDNVSPLNIVSIGNNTGILNLTLPFAVDTFGYGYAVLNTVAVPTATTIALFAGATPVGSLSYNGVPDPTFAGGFAGIQSTIAFNRVEITFNSTLAPAFALDNIRTFDTQAAAVPEAGTMALLATGLSALYLVRRRR